MIYETQYHQILSRPRNAKSNFWNEYYQNNICFNLCLRFDLHGWYFDLLMTPDYWWHPIIIIITNDWCLARSAKVISPFSLPRIPYLIYNSASSREMCDFFEYFHSDAHQFREENTNKNSIDWVTVCLFCICSHMYAFLRLMTRCDDDVKQNVIAFMKSWISWANIHSRLFLNAAMLSARQLLQVSDL